MNQNLKIILLSLSLLTILLVFYSNTVKQKSISFGLNDGALWIEDGKPLPKSDSLFYLENPTSLFRKEFKASQPIKSANLQITAAGYYKVSINGSRINENILDPAWTDFSKRIYYSEYDVTKLLKNGNNCIGVTIGNGFYNPLPLRKWGRRNLRNDLTVGKPTFIAKLSISYENGQINEIVTNNSWKFFEGPIRKNSVYLGTFYNANFELNGWDKPNFDDKNWQFVKLGKSPGGQLIKSFFPPVKIKKEITPINIYSPQKNIWIVDMGVNFTGTYKIKLNGKAKDTITFKFGERVFENGFVNPMTTVVGQIKKKGFGGPGAPEIAWQTDSYVLSSEKNQWFTPDFTYHTFRYIEIKGLKDKPKISDIRGLLMHSDVEKNNKFSSSSNLINSIQDAVQRTFLSNLISVQSDCPARERFAYGGDLNATSEAFIYNFDMQSFYRKTIYDWVDAMNDSTFVDTAPYTGIKYCGISWESAFLITQYNLYLYYNDTTIIKELYDLNNKWMDKVARIHPKGIVDKGLSDHESLEPVPVELTGTSHYLQCAKIMKEFASVMNIKNDVKKYDALANKLKNQIKTEFWDKPIKGKINKQTLFSTLLYHDVLPKHDILRATDSLLMAIKNGPTKQFNTGIFGTKYILETLAQYGTYNSVFDIVNSKKYPGWGFMIDRGATTLWETWKESDNMYSNNHPMFGSVSEWYYRWLAGIQPDPENPGFKTFFIKPTTPKGLKTVNCSYKSPFGVIESNWKKTNTSCIFEITVPKKTKAYITLPILKTNTQIINDSKKNKHTPKIDGLQSGNFILTEGQYKFIVTAKN